MGVYVKGIEMPANCSECAFCGYYGNGEHMCDIIEKAVEYESGKTSRRDDCPLVPVPPHGRLIDGDALSAKLNKMIAMAFGEGNTAFHFAYRSLGKVVENAHTIIPASGGTDNE